MAREKIVGGIQILVRRFGVLGRIGYASRGPALSENDPELFRLFIDRVLAVARAEKLRYLAIQPPFGLHGLTSPLAASGFHPVHFQVAPTATVLVDVTQNPERLLAQMRSGARRAIRKALQSPLQVRRATEQDIPTLQRLLSATAARQGFSPPSPALLENMWRSFSSDGRFVALLAERGGAPVACELDIRFGDVLVSKRCGWSGEFAKEHPTELLVWHGMQWARENGMKFYELEGMQPSLADAICRHESLPPGSEKSAHWFKLGFGGSVMTLPQNHGRFLLPGLGWMHQLTARALAWHGGHRLSSEPMTGSLRAYVDASVCKDARPGVGDQRRESESMGPDPSIAA